MNLFGTIQDDQQPLQAGSESMHSAAFRVTPLCSLPAQYTNNFHHTLVWLANPLLVVFVHRMRAEILR